MYNRDNAKNKLNSVYGISSQKCDKPLTELLQENYRKEFRPYACGVWATYWALARLQDTDVFYCDTDRVYYSF